MWHFRTGFRDTLPQPPIKYTTFTITAILLIITIVVVILYLCFNFMQQYLPVETAGAIVRW